MRTRNEKQEHRYRGWGRIDSGTARTVPAYIFGGTVADAKVSAEIKNRNASLVTRTDAQGHFKFSGFNKDIDPKDVEITCTKEGFKLRRTIRRAPPSGDTASSIEVDCLMAK